MQPLSQCRWREELGHGRHLCKSKKFVNAPNVIGAATCLQCCYVDHEPPPPLPRALPCVHLETSYRDAGRGNGAAPGVFGCAMHGRCVLTAASSLHSGLACCASCPDYLHRDPCGPSSTDMRRRADAFLQALPPYPPRRYRGRGVVIVGGGERFFPSLYVTVRALRHVGCTLPIQVWYLGRHEELPAARQALLAPYGVECFDADRVRRRWPARRLDGWELKVFATLHSSFAEVLFLDADCYPCRNPELLFALDAYRELGAIFWPDISPRDDRLKWPAFAVANPGRPGTIESGQFLINKKQCWRPLNLAWFYNDHSEYYYRYCYGDKHTFEVAWTRCQQLYVMWQPQAEWQEVAYVHVGPEGAPLFVHRCADKFRFKPEAFTTPQRFPGQAYIAKLPLESACWQWLSELTTALAHAERRRLQPERIVRIGLPGHFNGSLLLHQDRWLLASRAGVLAARLCLSELGPDFQPRSTRQLDIQHPAANAGAEDPRLFVYRGRLHCAFTGLERRDPALHIHQMICRLTKDLQVEKVWLPRYGARTPIEKNWQFFVHEQKLYAVYSVQPHVVLLHRGQSADAVAHTAPELPWRELHLRGGAPPVRVGDEYYHFFHTMRQDGTEFEYAVGLYTFAAHPPFDIRRVAPEPILTAQHYDQPSGLGKRVVFPCGAVRREGRWLISYGYHDHECRLAIFAEQAIEAALQPLGKRRRRDHR